MGVCTRYVVVGLLALTLGLHWAVLQSVAWTGMLINYARDGSWSEAISKTFDGQHPCKLCLLVQEGRAAEQQEKQPASLQKKLDWGLVWQPLVFLFEPNHLSLTDFIDHFSCRTEAPPTPPPRRLS